MPSKRPAATSRSSRHFAVHHDCKRENEIEDPEHGRRAADYARRPFRGWRDSPFTKKERDLLLEACRYHNDSQISTDQTIGTCWDADQLDLIRVNVIPDRSLEATAKPTQRLKPLKATSRPDTLSHHARDFTLLPLGFQGPFSCFIGSARVPVFQNGVEMVSFPMHQRMLK